MFFFVLDFDASNLFQMFFNGGGGGADFGFGNGGGFDGCSNGRRHHGPGGKRHSGFQQGFQFHF